MTSAPDMPRGPKDLPAGEIRLKTLGIERYWRQQNGGDAYLTLYETAREKSGSNTNAAKQNRFFTLYQMVRRVIERGIPGDMVECGCWKGHSTLITAETLAAGAWTGRMFVFDSFEGGLSDKVDMDRTARGDTDPSETLRQKEAFASSYDEVARLLAPYPFASVHRGWIPEVFADVPDLADRVYSLVHLDVDLFEPTRDSLDFFAPRMAPGGVIVLDDYGSALFPGAKAAVDAYMAKHPPRFFLESHLMGGVILF